MTSETGQQALAPQPPAPERKTRYGSLDVARGAFLVVNVAVISVLAPVPAPFEHSAWTGVTFIDVIFPLFVTLSGCGLAFAYRGEFSWRRTLRRSAVLLLVGLVYNMIAAGSVDLATLRFTGPLQIYAVLVLVIGALHMKVRTPRGWMVVTLVFAALHAFFLAAWQAGCPGGELLVTCNPSLAIDQAMLGAAHTYTGGVRGHDPEGLVAVFGALVTMCAGTTAGHLMLASRGTRRGPVRLMAWAGVVFTLAVVASTFLPSMKRLWTTPFALGIGAVGIVVLVVAMVVMDSAAAPRWDDLRARLAWPLIALGRNSLLVYFGSHIVLIVLLHHEADPSWAMQVAQAIDFTGHPRTTFVVAMSALWVITSAVLHRHKIYIRA